MSIPARLEGGELDPPPNDSLLSQSSHLRNPNPKTLEFILGKFVLLLLPAWL
ncbi:hypothetical protein [Leptospira kanakyensis]|uniref:hypothetical protein n=1 Tax=Leptospira kanakyensis TaxID=2484968 RepID=UPI00142D62FE|nr:hypothetical protein [Leptospira kanakyensis]